MHSVDKLTQPMPPPVLAPEQQEEPQGQLNSATTEVILNDGTSIHVQADDSVPKLQ